MYLSHLLLRIARNGLLGGIIGNLLFTSPRSDGQTTGIPTEDKPDTGYSGEFTLDTRAVSPYRFIAAHGRRALIAGYASAGLEVWAYPFEILNGYKVSFHREGASALIPGQQILSRVTYTPYSIVRVYLGPDFIVRETLFVPLDKPGAILSYQVQSAHPVEIQVSMTPVLNLMWPAALGGQSVEWSPVLSAYRFSEPNAGWSAVVGSPDVVAHDSPANRTTEGVNESGLDLTLRPDNSGIAHIYMTLDPPQVSDPGASYHELVHDRPALETQAITYFHESEDRGLRVETPDVRVNQALAWSEIALEQAWVCNPQLGCGIVAGYGPSRSGRRPQYDWFFAGDGLIATDALISGGNYTRARQELEFILRYQDAKTGMIWHELSQSAGFLDWAGKYPYMYVHVDISFQFLPTVARYVVASGDQAFARDHWKEIAAVYTYCRSLIDPTDGLPRIPSNKEGSDEQDQLSDDLGLSSSWVAASSAFAQLATLTDHSSMAKEAAQASRLARASIPNRYWDAKRQFWIDGYAPSGKPMPEHRSSYSQALELRLFSPQQNAALLDQLASSAFQTDWGTRGVGAGSTSFNPESYSKGSVSALNTTDLAMAFWAEHRPSSAFEMWSSLLPWLSLDSLGHMHEVLAGNVYRPQVESVPEQTWSSAAFLNGAIRGMLGLQVDSITRRIVFAPHLPATWDKLSLANIRLADAKIALTLHRTSNGLNLEIDNPANPVRFEFVPEIPLGAHLAHAKLNGKPIAVAQESYPQELRAKIEFSVPHGRSELQLPAEGGVSVLAVSPIPLLGEQSTGAHVINLHQDGSVLTITVDVPSHHDSQIRIQTDQDIDHVEGASMRPISDDVFELTFAGKSGSSVSEGYVRANAILQFKPRHRCSLLRKDARERMLCRCSV